MSVPHIGMPAMKDFVPSIGSSTQTYSASARSLPYSSPTIAVIRKGAPDQCAHGRFGRAIRRRHRIEAAATALVLHAQRGAEERQDRLARYGGELVDEGCKVDGGHALPRACFAFGPIEEVRMTGNQSSVRCLPLQTFLCDEGRPAVRCIGAAGGKAGTGDHARVRKRRRERQGCRPPPSCCSAR